MDSELRRAGVVVGTGRIATFARAVELAPHELYWVGRATLIGRRRYLPDLNAREANIRQSAERTTNG